MKYFLIFLLIHSFGYTQIQYQAEALWEAKDFATAEGLYQKIDSEKLTGWQKARLQYNLGTLALANHQTADAIRLLQKIAPSELSLPQFGNDLLINQAISYLQYAKELKPDSPFFDLKGIYLNESLKLFKQVPPNGWTQNVLEEMYLFHQQKASDWMSQASIETLSTFLSILLQQLNSLKAPAGFMEQQMESLEPVWAALKNKKFSPTQQKYFNEAYSERKNPSKATEKLSHLNFKENISLNLAHLSYQILLLQPSIGKNDLATIKWEVEQIKGNKESIEKIKFYLEKSLESRFFLLAGFGWLETLFPSDTLSPLDCLQKAFNQATRSLEMLFLGYANDEILKEQQQLILHQGNFFIPSVLKEQTSTSCQQFPWDQVIPLFDHGYFAAKRTDLEQTVQDWHKAIQLLKNPMKNQTQGETPAVPKNLAETFRLIQEMYLEDQTEAQPEREEFHSW